MNSVEKINTALARLPEVQERAAASNDPIVAAAATALSFLPVNRLLDGRAPADLDSALLKGALYALALRSDDAPAVLVGDQRYDADERVDPRAAVPIAPVIEEEEEAAS